jgi:hypothetical protein
MTETSLKLIGVYERRSRNSKKWLKLYMKDKENGNDYALWIIRDVAKELSKKLAQTFPESIEQNKQVSEEFIVEVKKLNELLINIQRLTDAFNSILSYASKLGVDRNASKGTTE